MRRSVAERKIALAAAIFEFFCARFRAAMAAFRAETATSRPVGRWGSVSMAESGGSYKRGGTRSVQGIPTPTRRPFNFSLPVPHRQTSLVRRAVFTTVAIGETNGRPQRISGIAAE